MNTKSDDNTILAKVIEQTLAKFALMFGEPAGKEAIIGFQGDGLTAVIRFRNFASGAIYITIPADLCIVLAANAIGTETKNEVAAANCHDALKEFTNVAAGHYVSEVFGKKENVEIMPPEIIRLDNNGLMNAVNDAQVLFLVDGNPIMARAVKG
jgi:CheY-specific phosphatase CheX